MTEEPILKSKPKTLLPTAPTLSLQREQKFSKTRKGRWRETPAFGHSFHTHIQGRALPVQAEGAPPAAAFISLFGFYKTQVQRAAGLELSSQGFVLWRNQRSLQPAALLLTPEPGTD